MIFFLELTFIFFMGCILGYLLELFFRRIVHKKWINPGFLVGPWLPLYGCGLTALFVVCSFDYSFIPSPVFEKVFVIALIALLMTLIEYITGLIFIKGMNVKLWDYSSRPGNIQGIICPLFSFFWAVIGAVYYLFVHDAVVVAAEWLCSNLQYSFFVGIVFGLFFVDVCYSFHVVTKIRSWAKEHATVVKYEELKLSIRKRAEELKQKHNFVLPLRSPKTLLEELKHYAETHQENKRNKKK